MAKPGPKPGTPMVGRPRMELDWRAIEEMAAIFCTPREIATVQRVSHDTLEKHCKRKFGKTFGVWCDEKRDIGRHKLRNVQMQAALKGNVTMMIWLGKQLLGQSDKVDQVDKYWTSKKGKEELIAMGREAIAIVQAATHAVQELPPLRETPP